MTDQHSPTLRHAIVGVAAGVYQMHRPGLQLETTEVVGVNDMNVELGKQRADELGCPFYADYHQMLAETQPDVTVILTPHPLHAPMTLDALAAGSHVLVEKPMSVHVAQADDMVAAAEAADRLLAVNFQQRFRPEIRAAYRLIREGRLGQIQHVDMKVVWPRTNAYYQLAGWRGTWAGEGGGVLMNQACHNLDIICHLMGMPERVTAWTRNLIHQIETEDTVNAMLLWSGGTLGSIHISTAEAGIPERLEILGTGGVLQINQGSLSFRQFESSLPRFFEESDEPFSEPDSHPVPVALESGAGDHRAIYRDLHQAILQGTPLMVDGRAGLMSLELANAMIYSSYIGQEVSLPLSRARYVELLDRLVADAQS
jgi:predicted dehydrogenase